MVIPRVGATITLVGAAAFNAACRSAIASFGALQTAATTTARGVQTSFTTMGTSINNSTTAIIASTTAATAAITGLAAASVVMGAEFVQNVVNAGAAVDATNKDLVDMGDIVLELSRRWAISDDQLQENLGSYMRAGGSMKDLKAGVYEYIISLQAASAGELNLNQAVMMVTGSQGAFNLHGRETVRITNAITAAANASAISYKDIYRTVPQAAAAYAAMGYTFEDLMTVTAMLGQEYLRNSDAGTAMKQMIISLLNPSKKAIEYMKEYGISLFDDKGNAIDLIDVVAQLNKAFADIDESMPDETILNQKKGQALAAIFGADALRPALILAKRGPEAFAKMQTQIQATSASDISKKMIEPASAQFKILTNQVEAFGTIIGAQVEPAFRRLLTDANMFLQTFTAEQIGMIGKAFSSMITGVGFDKLNQEAEKLFTGNVLRAFDSFVKLLYTIRDTVINQIVPSFQYLIESITGGADAAYTLSTIFDSLSSSIQLFARVVVAINVALGDLISWIKKTEIGAIALEIIFKGILALPFVALVAVFIAIASAISSIIGPVLIASLAIGAIITAFEHWNDIVAIVTSVVDAIVGTFSGIVSSIKEIIDPIVDTVVVVFESIYNTVSGVVNGIVSFISGNFDIIASIIGGVLILLLSMTLYYLGAMAVAWASTLVPAIIAAGSVIIPAIGGIILSLVALATQAAFTAVAVVSSFVGSIVPAVVAAAGAVIAALSSILLPLAILAAASAGLYIAWKTNFLGIQDFVGKILTWVSEQIAKFINWLKSLPIIGQWVEGVAGSINLIGSSIGSTFEGAKDTLGDFIDTARKGIEKYTGDLKGSLPSMDDFQKKLDAIRRVNSAAADEAERNAEAQRRQDEINKLGTVAATKKAPTPGFPEGGGDSLSKGDKLKALTADIMRALKNLPIMTKDLAEFLAQLATDAPERLQPILSALLGSKDALQSIVNLKREILKIDLELVQISIRQQYLQAQIAAIEAKEKLVQIQYARQLLDLQTAQARLDLQIIPARQRISDIDSEISRLQRDNLELVRQRAQAEIALLPYKKQLLQIDQQIKELSWKNYSQLIAQAEAEYNILPYKQKIAQYEKQITDLVDERLQLQQEESQLLAQRELTLLDRQIKDTDRKLDAAWQKMDIAGILKLEDQSRALEDQRSAAQENLDNINAQIEDQKFLQEITANRLKQEEQFYKDLIKPVEDYLFNLKQQMDLEQAGKDLAILRLQAERQAVEQLMQPYQNVIDMLNLEIEAEKTRNAVRVADLQIEKQALEDMIEPLQRMRDQYQAQIDIINAQITVQNYMYETQKIQYEQLNAMEEARRTDLETTKATIELVFTSLVQQYAMALVASQAFSTEEAYEVVKRLGLWNDQIAKLAEVVTSFSNIKGEADEVTKAIDAIPKNVTIVITTVHKDVYETSGSPTTGGNQTPSFAQGGVVPGPYGKPIVIIAHGGERFMGLRNTTPTIIDSAQYRAPARASQNIYNTNYNVDANYANMQSPASVKMDLQALAAKTRR